MCIRKCPVYTVKGVKVGNPYDGILSALLGRSAQVPDCYAYGQEDAFSLKPTAYETLFATKTTVVMRTCMFIFLLFFVRTIIFTVIKVYQLRSSKCKMRLMKHKCMQAYKPCVARAPPFCQGPPFGQGPPPGRRPFMAGRIQDISQWMGTNILRRRTPPPPIWTRIIMTPILAIVGPICGLCHMASCAVSWLISSPQRQPPPSWGCILRHCFIESLYEPFIWAKKTFLYIKRKITGEKMTRKCKMDFVPSYLFDRFVPYHPVTQMKVSDKKK